jgi:hypothetical protein
MTALGQERTSRDVNDMFALPPITDMEQRRFEVR